MSNKTLMIVMCASVMLGSVFFGVVNIRNRRRLIAAGLAFALTFGILTGLL